MIILIKRIASGLCTFTTLRTRNFYVSIFLNFFNKTNPLIHLKIEIQNVLYKWSQIS